jgi:hypothetical protein
VAFVARADEGASRFLAALIGLVGFGVLWVLAARLPVPVRALGPAMSKHGRAVVYGVYGVVLAVALIVAYALVGTPWPLVLAIVAAAVAEFAVFGRGQL